MGGRRSGGVRGGEGEEGHVIFEIIFRVQLTTTGTSRKRIMTSYSDCGIERGDTAEETHELSVHDFFILRSGVGIC